MAEHKSTLQARLEDGQLLNRWVESATQVDDHSWFASFRRRMEDVGPVGAERAKRALIAAAITSDLVYPHYPPVGEGIFSWEFPIEDSARIAILTDRLLQIFHGFTASQPQNKAEQTRYALHAQYADPISGQPVDESVSFEPWVSTEYSMRYPMHRFTAARLGQDGSRLVAVLTYFPQYDRYTRSRLTVRNQLNALESDPQITDQPQLPRATAVAFDQINKSVLTRKFGAGVLL